MTIYGLSSPSSGHSETRQATASKTRKLNVIKSVKLIGSWLIMMIRNLCVTRNYSFCFHIVRNRRVLRTYGNKKRFPACGVYTLICLFPLWNNYQQDRLGCFSVGATAGWVRLKPLVMRINEPLKLSRFPNVLPTNKQKYFANVDTPMNAGAACYLLEMAHMVTGCSVSKLQLSSFTQAVVKLLLNYQDVQKNIL